MTPQASTFQDVFQLLTPPGGGIHTVSSGSEFKFELWEKYFQTTKDQDVHDLWAKNLQKALNQQISAPFILSCPSDSGAAILKGSNWGPLFLRLALLESLPHLLDYDLGDIKINPHLLSDEFLTDDWKKIIRSKMFPKATHPTLPVSPLSQLDWVTSTLWKHIPKKKLLLLAGDHSNSYPIVKNWCLSRTHPNIAVIHFDAHTDLLEERLGVPVCFGSWAYQALKYLPGPKHLVQLGIRASGKDQKYWEDHLGVKQFWAKDIKKQATEFTLNALTKHLDDLKIKELYISFDVDVLDPAYLSCTGTAEEDGLFPHHVCEILRGLKNKYSISSVDVVEFAPFIRYAKTPFSRPEPETSMLTLKNLMSLFWECLTEKNS